VSLVAGTASLAVRVAWLYLVVVALVLPSYPPTLGIYTDIACPLEL
jgi:hypothetical protein